MERVAEGARKVQFSANLGLIKPRAIIDSSNIEPEERIDIYANFDMKLLVSLGLEDDEFFEMVEKMQAVLETFASYGSGWVLQHVIQVFVKLAKFSPIHESFYKDLPFRIGESQNLIKIRNHDDHNFFDLCFTGAYNLKHGISLLLTDQQKLKPAAAPTQPDTYPRYF